MAISKSLRKLMSSPLLTPPDAGPADSLLFYVFYLFNNAFMYFKMGYACAMAWILFFIIFGLTLLQIKLAPRWVHYESEK